VADDAEGPALIDFLLLTAVHLEDRSRHLRFRKAGWLKTHDHFLFRFHDEKNPQQPQGSGDRYLLKARLLYVIGKGLSSEIISSSEKGGSISADSRTVAAPKRALDKFQKLR
jgi:hypothetical protein